jgi:hypothetical protein
MSIVGLAAPHGRVRRSPGTFIDRGLMSDFCPIFANGSSLLRVANLARPSASAVRVSGATAQENIRGAWIGSGIVIEQDTAFEAPSTGWKPNTAGGHAPATLMMLFQVSTVQQSGSWFGCIAGATTYPAIWIAASSNLQGAVALSSGGIRVMTTSVSAAPAGNLRFVCVTTRSATDHETIAADYVTGVHGGATDTNSSTSAPNDAAREYFGQAAGIANFGTRLTLLRAMTWNVGLSSQQMKELRANPFMGWELDDAPDGWWMESGSTLLTPRNRVHAFSTRRRLALA